MSLRHMFFGLVAALALVAAGEVLAVCPGVDHTNSIASGWEYDEFFEAGTQTPLSVTLAISQISRPTVVEYFNGAAWIEVTGPISVEGSKTRFTEGGYVEISYTFEACGDEVQPSGS